MNLWELTISVCVVLCIFLSNILLLTFNKDNYLYLIEKNDIHANFPKEQNVDRRVAEFVDYFRGKNNLEDNFFSNQAKSHLKDVKFLINVSLVTCIIALAYLLLVQIYLSKKKKIANLLLPAQKGAIVTLVIVALITIMSIVNFDFLFIKFHQILFRNNYWLFDESDNIVRLFTDSFFTSFAKQLFLNITISSIALLLFTKLLQKR